MFEKIKCKIGKHMWSDIILNPVLIKNINSLTIDTMYYRYCKRCLMLQEAPMLVNQFGEHCWKYVSDSEIDSKLNKINNQQLKRKFKLKKLKGKMTTNNKK